VSLTEGWTHLCKLVALKVNVFLHLLFFLFLITCRMFAARQVLTCVLIISGWHQLVDMEKCIEATRTIHATLQFLLLICSILLVLIVLRVPKSRFVKRCSMTGGILGSHVTARLCIWGVPCSSTCCENISVNFV
jgi:hypothetical protein